MTIRELLRMVDSTKPNAFDDEAKLQWVNDVEGLVQTEIFLRAVEDVTTYTTADMDTVLLVRPPHAKLYWAYLYAMVDLCNGEYDKYDNSMAVFNSFWREFAVWFGTRYRPADTHEDRYSNTTPMEAARWRGYYLTAYGIAVKHGYPGTEEEWLCSLKGIPVELQYDRESNALQWRYEGEDIWKELLPLEDLQGEVVHAVIKEAEAARDAAIKAAKNIEDMGVYTKTGEVGTTAAVEKSVSPDGDISLTFTIPKGDKGDRGDVQYASFFIDHTTGQLSMRTTDGYQGPAFKLDKNGYLEVII